MWKRKCEGEKNKNFDAPLWHKLSARERALARSLATPTRSKMWLFLLRWALIFSVLYWALKR